MKNFNFALAILIFPILVQNTFCEKIFRDSASMSEKTVMKLRSELSQKQDEINRQKVEIEQLKSEKELLQNGENIVAAGFGSGAEVFVYMLLFSITVGTVSAFVVRRKTRSLCHCLNRRKKLLKKQKMEEKALNFAPNARN
jgi:hypothetical protein